MRRHPTPPAYGPDKRTKQSKGASLYLFYGTCSVLWGNSTVSKDSGTSLWNFVPNSGLIEFLDGKSIALSTKLVDDGRACWQHLHVRRSTRRGWTHIVYYTSVDRNASTPLLLFRGVDLCKIWVGPNSTVWGHMKQRRYFCYITGVKIHVDSC